MFNGHHLDVLIGFKKAPNQQSRCNPLQTLIKTEFFNINKRNDNMQDMNFAHHQKSWKWLIPLPVLLLGLLLTLAPLPIFALVGYVDYVKGPSIAFSLNGQKALIATGKQLNEGDTIRVHQSGASVTLLLGSQPIQITYTHNNPYTVPKPSPPKSGLIMAVSNWVGELFKWNRRTSLGVTRSIGCQQPTNLRFSIPLLAAEKQAKLLAGERPLSFGWQGGTSPYDVQIYRLNSGEVTQLQTSLTDCASLKEVTLPIWHFKEGERYQVKVTDQSQQVAVGQFTVVSRRYDPRKKAISTETQKELQSSCLVRAIWFAQQGYGEWQLEAYQQFLGVETTHSAKILKRGLAEGSPLPTN
jgi:hypothetical protein